MNPVLLCLHGWGGTKESFSELKQELEGSGLTILVPDLPGFGSEKEPDHAWTTDDYAGWVEKFIGNQESGIRNQELHLLGHSHGGRIAIKLATRKRIPIKHLYLCAAAGIRRPKPIRKMAGLALSKSGKTILKIPGIRNLQIPAKKILYKLFRVHDYEKASPVMRQTMISVTSEDLTPLLRNINVPTDIFWGALDSMTPVSDAHLIHSNIPGSILHIYENVRHRIHRDRAGEIAEIIRVKIKTP